MKNMNALLLTVICSIALRTHAQAPVVYLNFLSHNEDASSWSNSGYYLNNRAKLITLTNYFVSKGATFNLQSDYTYLNAAISKETGTVLASTNNKTILRWMYEDKGVEMDPHSHENVYIYPDIVKLMDSIGLPESKVIGGTLYNQMNGINSWTNLINGQNGVIFPNKFWKPDYMMGGGTPQHTADINAYGFWNPQSMSSYLTHDPLQPLEHFGVGCEIKIKDTTTIAVAVNKVRDLINKVQTGQYPQSGFYYQTIFFGHGDITNTTVYDKLLQMTDSLAAIVATGKAQWKTMKQGYTIWETAFGAQMDQWLCGQLVGMDEELKDGTGFSVFPVPGNGTLHIKKAEGSAPIEKVQLFDTGGRQLKVWYPASNEVTLELEQENGMYFVQTTDSGKNMWIKKIVIQK